MIKKIEEIITSYFILKKRWLRCRGRLILFDERDSERLAQSLASELELDIEKVEKVLYNEKAKPIERLYSISEAICSEYKKGELFE